MSYKAEIFEACLTLVISQKWDTTRLRQVSHRKKMIWLKKNEISQMGGAYLMSQKLKICKCISYACLTVIWLANSGSIELCEIIYQLNFIYLCISCFLSTNVQSYQNNFCEIQQTLWHVTCLASHFETGLISHLTLRCDKRETSVKNFSLIFCYVYSWYFRIFNQVE